MYRKLEQKQIRQMRHEWIKQGIKTKNIAIFFITKKFIKEKERYEEAMLAESLSKVMYAVIKKGVRWERFKKFPWRNVYYFSTKEELQKIMHEIIIDINLIHAIIEVKTK